jgi:hypothetical protein
LRDPFLICQAATGDVARGFDLRPLPKDVVDLLFRVDAPPRLAAHLRVVCDVAVHLVESFGDAFPSLRFDAAAVVYGAGIHDIGKALHPTELQAPGNDHEVDGYRLLIDSGIPARLARFARSHGEWDATETTVEDEMVALADKVWQGRREKDLEHKLVVRITAAEGEEPWRVVTRLDDLLAAISSDADRRLDFQSRFAAS